MKNYIPSLKIVQLFFIVLIPISSVISQSNVIYYGTFGGVSYRAEIVKAFTPGDPNPQLRFRHTNLSSGASHYEDFMDYVSDAGERWRASVHYDYTSQSLYFKHCRFNDLSKCHHDVILNIRDFSAWNWNYKFESCSLQQLQNANELIKLTKKFISYTRHPDDPDPQPESIKRICPGSSIPSGWVIIGQEPCVGSCNDRAGQACNIRIIKNLNGLSAGTVQNICPGSTVPTGWIVVGGEPCGGTCGDRAGQVCAMQRIKKL